MHLRALKFLYTTPLLATVYRHREEFTRITPGLNDKVLTLDATMLADKKWLNARNMVARIRRAVIDDIAANKAPVLLGETGRVWIESIAPESNTAWETEKGPDKTLRFILPLETNPGVVTYVGGQGLHLEAGGLWWINIRAPHCLLNAGLYPVVNFMVEFAVGEAEAA